MKGKLKNDLELFKTPLVNIINRKHPIVEIADRIDWKSFDDTFSTSFCPNNGRPSVPMRLMIGLSYLKYTFEMSDEEVVYTWVENPYWQYFTGNVYFEHKLPIDPSSMTRFRNRLKVTGFEKLLEETIKLGLDTKVIKKKDLERVNVDTTVQEKNITFPTDAKLYYKGICLLAKFAKANEIRLKQTYKRVGKRALVMSGRYAHSRKMNKAKSEIKSLKTCLGRLLRDLERKIERKISNDPLVYECFLALKEKVIRVLNQKREDKNKLYSFHAPEVECISKGKAHKKYEFGCKVGIVTTSNKNFILAAAAFHGNPYDGHTLKENLENAQQRLRGQGEIRTAIADRGYKGHGYKGEVEVIIQNGKRKTPPNLYRLMKRRSAIEPIIGHMKNDHRMEKNYLLGKMGDKVNALLSACGFNMKKLIRAFFGLILRMLNSWKLVKILVLHG
jgi:IS5 family transposase